MSKDDSEHAASGETDEFVDDPRHKNAARVARVLVSDLYLYCKDDVDDGIRARDLAQRRDEAFADMRGTYDERLSEDVRQEKDHLQLAIDAFVTKKRKELAVQ